MKKKQQILQIIYGKKFKVHRIKIGYLYFCKAFFLSLKARKILRQRGIYEAIEFASSKKKDLLVFNTEIEHMYCAREIVNYHMKLSRLLGRSTICLERSISASALLAYLGVSHDFVLGKIRYFSGGNYPFHAWLEINGNCINDISGVNEFVSRVYFKTF